MALRPPLWRQCAKCSEGSSFSFHAPRLSGWEAGIEDQRRTSDRREETNQRCTGACAMREHVAGPTASISSERVGLGLPQGSHQT